MKRKLFALVALWALVPILWADVLTTSQLKTTGGGGASGITSGTTQLAGFVDGDILYNNGGVAGGFAIYDDTGSGDGAFALRKTTSGTSTTSNFFSVTGTLGTNNSTTRNALYAAITDPSTAGQGYGLHVVLTASGTGNQHGAAIYGEHAAGGSSYSFPGVWGSNAQGDGNMTEALYWSAFTSSGPPTRSTAGVSGSFSGATTSGSGVDGRSSISSATQIAFGGRFFGTNATSGGSSVGAISGAGGHASANVFGLIVQLDAADMTLPAGGAALLVDNVTRALDIFVARDNGTAVFTIADGGVGTWASGGEQFSNNIRAAFGGAFTEGTLRFTTSHTPDSFALGTGPTSEAIHVAQSADLNVGFDYANCAFGTSAASDPMLCIHSANQDTQEYLAFWHDRGAGVIQAGNSTAKSFESKFGKTVALTEAGGAETVITITNATTQVFGVDLYYTITATDATDRATRKGYLQLVCDNAATVMTCTKDATAETDDASILIATGGATLTYAIATDVATANTAKITFNIDSSLVVSAASITWQANLTGTGSIQ